MGTKSRAHKGKFIALGGSPSHPMRGRVRIKIGRTWHDNLNSTPNVKTEDVLKISAGPRSKTRHRSLYDIMLVANTTSQLKESIAYETFDATLDCFNSHQ